ncbi:MAG: hypothetical protein AB8G96_04125 [Phycisphaerales bacterium]
MPQLTHLHQPGKRVKVTQQMPTTGNVITTSTEGTIVAANAARTGSWYAHGKDDKLWLDRLELRLDDGEIVVLNLDQYSLIEHVTDEDLAARAAEDDAA